MDDRTFTKLAEIIYNKSGITLNQKKKALVEGRIAKRVRELNLSNHKEYLDFVTDRNNGDEIENLIDVISTNVTHFYRESSHFEILELELKKWAKSGKNRIRIWSAAASSGEEPYTISMVASDALKEFNVDLRILATDISRPMLQKCVKAQYTPKALEMLPTNYIRDYMIKVNNHYRVSDAIKGRVLFKRVNLSKPPFPMRGPMDVIFIRNVMIYFDNRVKQKLINEAYRLLKVGGILFVGHSENLTEITHKFKTVAPATYKKI